MPTLGAHPSTSSVKLLLIGNTGVGKTGTLASLAVAGYRLFILDFDNGLDILLDPKILPPEFRKNVLFKTLTDKQNLKDPGLAIPSAATDASIALNDWSENEPVEPGAADKIDATKRVSYGNPSKWGEKDVLVIDSLTFWGNALLRRILFMNKRAGQQPWQSDWGDAIREQENTISALYAAETKCNVIITAHLSPVEDKLTGQSKLYPSALGSKLPMKIGRYFNNVVLMEKTMTGRVFKTVGTSLIDLKTSKPSLIPAEMSANLAEFFRLARGG